jgi:hypothetical protein
MVPAPLAEAPPLMVEQRTRVMKDVSDIIYQKLVKTIATEYDYKTKIAGPSASGYASMIHPDFVSRGGLNRDQIVQKQEDGVMGGWHNFRDNLKYMFETVNGEVNKRFRDAVDAKSRAYSKGMGKVLTFTGALAELGAGCVGLAVFWLTGDPLVQRHLRGDDKLIAGGPVNISIDTLVFRAGLTQRLIQSGRTLAIANWHPDAMEFENDKNNLIIRALQLNTYARFETSGASHCDWITIDGRQYLEVKVSTV